MLTYRSSSSIIILIVYVDDIIINGNDSAGIANFKTYQGQQFHKDLSFLRNFLGVKVERSKEGFSLCQQKYVLDLLSETGTLDACPVDTPMDSSVKLDVDSGDVFKDTECYQRLVGKLIYLNITCPDITYVVGIVCQFIPTPHQSHWEVVSCILRYLKGASSGGLLYRPSSLLTTVGFFMLIGQANLLIEGLHLVIVRLLGVI